MQLRPRLTGTKMHGSEAIGADTQLRPMVGISMASKRGQASSPRGLDADGVRTRSKTMMVSCSRRSFNHPKAARASPLGVVTQL